MELKAGEICLGPTGAREKCMAFALSGGTTVTKVSSEANSNILFHVNTALGKEEQYTEPRGRH